MGTMSPATHRRPVFYLIGDSLTQEGANPETGGWVTLLQHKHVRAVDVINRGLSGYNTVWFIEHALSVIADELKTTFVPSLVTLWLGANDAALPDGPSKNQHVSLTDYRARLTTIVKTLAPLLPTHAKILLITPPPVIDAVRRACNVSGNDLDRSDAMTAEYARACVAVGAAEGVPVLDLHTLLSATYPVDVERAALFSDGLHFSVRGNAVVAQHVANKIVDVFGAEETARFDVWQLPNWRDISG